ncbi:MAG: translocation/assembly module TamB domain-containing protein [Candidatus Zixiibacteriota bacterium]
MFKLLKKVFFLARDAVVIFFKIALVFVRALGISVGLIAVAGAVLVFALYGSGYFHKLTRFAIEKYMSGYTRTECRVGRVEGSLLTGLDIYDFVVGDGPSLERDGPALLIDEIHVRYDPMRFVRRDVTIDSIHCVRPWLVLREDSNGRLNLDRIFGPKGPPRGKGVYFVIENVFLEDAFFKMELNSPLTEFAHADIRCTFTKARGAVFIDLRHCSCEMPEFGQRIPHFGSGSLAINSRLMHFGGVDVASRTTHLSTYGTIKFDPDTYLDLRFTGDPFDVGEVGQGVFDDPPEFFGYGRYSGTLEGPPDHLMQNGSLTLIRGHLYGFELENVFVYYDFDIANKQIRVNGFEGRMNGTPTYVAMTMDLSGPKPVYWGEARVLRMNLADYLHSTYFETDVDTRIKFSGVGLSSKDYALDVTATLGAGKLGPVLVDGANADFTYTNGRADIAGLFLRLDGGDLLLSGLGDPSGMDFVIRGRDVPIERFGASGDLSRLRGLVSIEGRISGSYETPSFEGGVVMKDLEYDKFKVGTARGEGTWENFGGDAVADLHLMAWNVQAGPVYAERVLGDLAIENGVYAVSNGRIESEKGGGAYFDFAYDEGAGRLDISRLEVNLGGVRAELDEPLVVAREGRGYAVTGGSLKYSGGEVSVSGVFDPEGSLGLVAEARGVPLGELLPPDWGPSIGGRLDRIRVDVGGTADDPAFYASLAASNLTVNRQPIDYVHGEASYENKRIIIPGIVAGLLGGTARVSAYLPLSTLTGEGEEPVDVTLWFSRFKMEALTGLYDEDLVEDGYLDGVITVSGTTGSPVVDGSLLLSELRWGGVYFAKGRADFAYRDGYVDIRELSLAERTLPNLVITGRLPFSPDPEDEANPLAEMDVTAEFIDLDLRAVNPVTDEVLITDGKVRGKLTLGGTYDEPDLTGRIMVIDGAGTIRSLRSSFSELTGAVEARADRVVAMPDAPLTFSMDEGRGRVWGGVAFDRFTPTELDLTIDLEDYVIRAISGVQAKGDIRANIAGPIDNLQAVAEVNLTGGLITMELGEESPGGGESAAGGLDYEIRVLAPGNLWLRNKDAEIELEADVTIRRIGGRTSYTGTLEARRGYYYFLQRDFAVEQAEVVFTGTEELDPVINLRARRDIRASRAGNSDAVVYIDVTGTLREPELNLTYEVVSGPPVGLTQEEITRVLALDVTWDDLEDLSSGELASKGSSDYVRHYAEAEVARIFRRGTGVDVFEFDANVFSGAEENPYAEVTVGQHLTPDIFVSYTGRYREYAGGSHELEHAAEVDYEFQKDLYLVGSTYDDDNEQRYGLGIRFIHKY